MQGFGVLSLLLAVAAVSATPLLDAKADLQEAGYPAKVLGMYILPAADYWPGFVSN